MQRISSLIQWHEGMFLGPQHLQQLQKRNDEVAMAHNNLLHHFGWGVIDLRLDTLALADGLFQIEELQAFMPDNTFVHYPEESFQTPLHLDLKPFQQQAESKPLKIFLCIPELSPHRSSVIGEWPRYHSVEGSDIPDDNLQDNMVMIPRLHPKLLLTVSETYPARYTSFPIAEIGFQDSKFFLTEFLPPQLTLSPLHRFHIRATDIAARIRDKALYLSEKWEKQVGTTLMNETANQLRPLIKVLPMLEGSLRNQSLHPHTLYQLLCKVFGELSTMRLTVVPPLAPIYNHDHFARSIDLLLTQIEQLLSSIEQTVIMLPFNQRDRLFFLKMHESYVTRQLYLGIRAPSSMTESALFDWMKDAIIASDSTVESARTRRIIGAARYRLDHEELSDFLVGRGTLIFKLAYPSEFIKAGENLNIFNAADDEDRRPLSMVLYLKAEKAQVPHAA